MLVPLFVDLVGGGSIRMRVLVRGAVTDAELPPLPAKPKRVELNPDEAVLAKVRRVR